MLSETIAITYDICEHEDCCIDMNQYSIDLNKDFKEQAYKYAKMDVASLVKIVEVVKKHRNDDYGEFKPITEFIFEEFTCKCGEEE